MILRKPFESDARENTVLLGSEAARSSIIWGMSLLPYSVDTADFVSNGGGATPVFEGISIPRPGGEDEISDVAGISGVVKRLSEHLPSDEETEHSLEEDGDDATLNALFTYTVALMDLADWR